MGCLDLTTVALHHKSAPVASMLSSIDLTLLKVCLALTCVLLLEHLGSLCFLQFQLPPAMQVKGQLSLASCHTPGASDIVQYVLRRGQAHPHLCGHPTSVMSDTQGTPFWVTELRGYPVNGLVQPKER